MYRKTCVIIIMAFLVFVFFSYDRTETKKVHVGAVFTLTGSGAAVGQSLKNGLEMAIDEINMKGRIGGAQIELILRDSATDKGKARQCFDQIMENANPVFILTNMSFIALHLSPGAESHKLPLIGFTVSSPLFIQQNDWCFRYYTSVRFEAEAAVRNLQHLNAKRLGFIFLDDAYGKSVMVEVKKQFIHLGGETKAEPFRLGDTEYKTQIAHLMDMDAIYIVGFPGQQKEILIQLRENNFKGFVFGNSNMAHPDFTSMPEAQGAYTGSPLLYNRNYMYAKSIKKKYEERFEEPLNHHAAAAYDFMQIIAEIADNGELTRDIIHRAFETGFVHSGVLGTINVKKGTREILFPLYPAMIHDNTITFR